MVWCLSFRKQRAASCPSARPGCANGKGVRRDPKRNEIDRPTGQFRLSFWVEAPWSALRGWPLSNRTNNAARPSSRASADRVFCLRLTGRNRQLLRSNVDSDPRSVPCRRSACRRCSASPCSSDVRHLRRRDCGDPRRLRSGRRVRRCGRAAPALPWHHRLPRWRGNASEPLLDGNLCPCRSARRRGCAPARTDAWRGRRLVGAAAHSLASVGALRVRSAQRFGVSQQRCFSEPNDIEVWPSHRASRLAAARFGRIRM